MPLKSRPNGTRKRCIPCLQLLSATDLPETTCQTLCALTQCEVSYHACAIRWGDQMSRLPTSAKAPPRVRHDSEPATMPAQQQRGCGAVWCRDCRGRQRGVRQHQHQHLSLCAQHRLTYRIETYCQEHTVSTSLTSVETLLPRVCSTEAELAIAEDATCPSSHESVTW